MQYGLCTFPTDYSMPFPDLARAAEDRAFESIWVAEHSHIPASRKTPFPGGGELPKMYYDTYDPFVALAAAASVTQRIRLATGVCLVIQRDPIHTAKQVASLDHLSKGRFLFGVGAGWNLEEMANHGTTRPEQRGTLLRERIEAMQAIWREKQAEYHGTFVDFDPIFAWPKPVQKPHPPIHVGGGWPQAARRAVKYGQGWIPVGDAAGAMRRLPDFHALAREASRDPASLEVSVYYCPPDAELLRQMRDAGIARAVFGVPSEPAEKVLPLLDQYEKVARQVG
ncbi:MAG: LLM class F420-dependent oxidoreductase [Proteobacteria bacterium]|nr:MAG: LLM class F420-dependent oxidoreductase [Pseudomonadota bacterium]